MAVEVPTEPARRLTLTPVVLNQARNTFFLAAGADKRAIIAALRAEPESGASQYPAARIRPAGSIVWLLDRVAAGGSIEIWQKLTVHAPRLNTEEDS